MGYPIDIRIPPFTSGSHPGMSGAFTNPGFQKSGYSAQDINCVEVAQIPTSFRKSGHSGRNQDCVQVGSLPCGAAISDSKHPDAGYLPFLPGEWSIFLTILE